MNPEYTRRLREIEEELALLVPDRCSAEWFGFVEGMNDSAGGAAGNLADAAGVDAVPANTAQSASTAAPDPLRLSFLESILDPVRELLSRGGKRWRPVLMVCVCEMVGGDRRRALPLVPVVELAHNGSLIIDDIEDSAEYRRGGPAVHLMFGADTAINAGNFLYFFPALRIGEWEAADAERSAAYRIYMECMSRLHLGQGLDIGWHRNHEPLPTETEYLRMCRFKTGSLARMAAELGALAGGVGGAAERARLGALAERIGLAFQIMDDVVNLTTGNPGKKRGDDIVEGKKSLPVLLYLSRRPEKREFLFQAFGSAAALGMDRAGGIVEEVIAELEGSGAVEEARRAAAGMMDEAASDLMERYRQSAARDLVIEMTRGFL